MMICTGPASEEESSMHEKMYMIVREGPIHRCMFCGQCFKLIRLKDDVYDHQNTYYSTVFTEISPQIVSEQEIQPHWMTFCPHYIRMPARKRCYPCLWKLRMDHCIQLCTFEEEENG